VKEKSTKNEQGKIRGGYIEKVLKTERFKTEGRIHFDGKMKILKNTKGKH
jgi:hypothetical protein